MRSHTVCVWTLLTLGHFSATAAADVQLYFTSSDNNNGWIYRVEAGKGNPELLIETPSDGRPMMVETLGDHMYWSSYYPGQLWRSDVNGQGETLLVDQGDTTTRAIRFMDDSVYWANESLGAIYRSDLDGSNVETIIDGFFGNGHGIWDFDIHDGRIYWTSWSSSKVKSIRLDGTDFQDYAIPGYSRVFNVEVHNSRMYLTTDVGDLLSASLTGGDIDVLASAGDGLHSLDIHGDRAYYSSQFGGIASVHLGGGPSRMEFESTLEIWQIHAVPGPGASVMMVLALGMTRSRSRTD